MLFIREKIYFKEIKKKIECLGLSKLKRMSCLIVKGKFSQLEFHKEL